MKNIFFRIRRWSTTSFHNRRWFSWLVKFYSWLKLCLYRFVGIFVFRSRAKDETSLSQQMNRISEIPGWFLPNAIAVWHCLFSFQQRQKITGNMLEIGVWKGKSACCSSEFARDDETCVFVDRVILPEARNRVSSIRKHRNLFLERNSLGLLEHEEMKDLRSSFRWIHIDGEHSGVAVRQDLEMAIQCLAPMGVICIDDFPSNPYPQIYFEVVRFVLENPDYVLFASGHNKGYLCHKDGAGVYLQYIQNDLQNDMKELGVEMTVWKTGRQQDIDCFGFTDRVDQYIYRGPDWSPGQIVVG